MNTTTQVINLSLPPIVISFILLENARYSSGFILNKTFFRIMTLLIVVAIVSYMSTYILQGLHFTGVRVLALLFNAIYILLSSSLTFFWFHSMYRKTCQYFHMGHLKRRMLLSSLPFILSACTILGLSMMGFENPLFKITQQNTYLRGPLYWLPALCLFGYAVAIVALGFVFYFKTEDLNQRREYILLACLPLFPVAAYWIQSVWYNWQLIWPCAVLSMLSVYLLNTDRLLRIDALTTLNNRREIRSYYEQKARTAYGLMYLLDLDHFKCINDTFGHLEGDRVLRAFADLLKKTFATQKVFLARYGGDEFIIIAPEYEPSQENAFLKPLNEAVKNWNTQQENGITLGFSAGCAAFKPGDAFEALLDQADTNMYKTKNAKTGCSGGKQNRGLV